MEQVLALHDLIKQRDSTWEAIRNKCPRLAADIDRIEGEIPDARAEAKKALRLAGPGTHQYLDGQIKVQVKRPPTSNQFDLDDVLEMAEERGEVALLVEYGFLEYGVNPNQLSRLPEKLRAVYSAMGTKKEGTASVSLPSYLK